MIKIAIVGAAGRMGKTLVTACHETDGIELSVATEYPQSTLIGVDAGELAGVGLCEVVIAPNLASAEKDFDILIDFTGPIPCLKHLEWCQQNNKKNYYRYNRV